MARPQRHSRAERNGMCINKTCEEYKKSITVGHGDFVCPKCGKKLIEVKKGDSPVMKYVLFGGVGLAAAVGIYLGFFNNGSDPSSGGGDGGGDTIDTVVTPPPIPPVKPQDPDTIGTDTVTIPPQTPPEEQPKEPKKPVGVFGGAATRTIYGNMSTLTFKRTYTLDLHSRDGETITLYPGDKIEDAVIRHGILQSGNLIRTNGDTRRLTGLNNPL